MGTPRARYRAVYRSLSRDAKLLIAAGALSSLPFGVLSVALPIYLTRLGHSEVVVGSFFSVLGVVAVLLIIPFGIVADRFGRKRMPMLGGVFFSAAFFLLPLAGSLGVLYLIAAVGGLAEAMFFSTLQSLLADASRPETRTSLYSISFFTSTAASAAGSLASSIPDLLLTGLKWGVVNAYAPLFLGLGIALLVSPVLLTQVTVTGARKASGRGLLPRRSGKTITRFFVSNMIIGLGAGLVVPIFSLWFFLKFQQVETFTGPLFALSAVVNAFGFLVSPILAERHGMVRTIVTLNACAIAFLLGMAVAPWLPLAAVLYLARNAAMNMASPVSTSFLMGAVEPDERSSASAVVGVAFRFPHAVSTTFGAAMMTQNTDLPLFVTAGLYSVGVTAFWAFFRRVPGAQVRPTATGAQ